MALNFHDLTQFAALNHLFHRQETGIKAAVLVWRHRQPPALRQRKERLCLG